jgi:hypothetical protein
MYKKGIMGLVLILGFVILSQGAQAWTTTRLTWSADSSLKPVMAVDSSKNLYVFYSDDTPGNFEIFLKKSTDTGASWTTKRLTWNIGTSQWPSAAVDGNDYIHLVWQDVTPGNYEIYYRKSTDGGSSWSTKRLSTTPDYSNGPAIAIDSNNRIHVVWYDHSPGNNEIFYTMSTDTGATWTSKRLTWNQGESVTPAIAADSNDVVHLVWCDSSSGNPEIYYRNSTTSGATWSAPKRMTWSIGTSRFPKIVTDLSDNIHVVWDDDAVGNYEVFCKTSTDTGATWAKKRLTWNPGLSRVPDITAGFKNIIHVVWCDDTPGNDEIYYKWSSDGGSTWTTERLTWNAGASLWPNVVTHTTELIVPASVKFATFRVHVLWNDNSPGNAEIFHKYK